MVPCCSEAPTAPTAFTANATGAKNCGQRIVVAATVLVAVGCCGCFEGASKLFVQRIGVASITIVLSSSVFGVFVCLAWLAASGCSASKLINERASGCGLLMISRTPFGNVGG